MSKPTSSTPSPIARRRSRLLAGVVAAALLLGACGSDDDDGAGADTTETTADVTGDEGTGVDGSNGTDGGDGGDDSGPAEIEGEPSGDDRIVVVESGFGSWEDVRDAVITTGSGVELANVSDETVTNVVVTIKYIGDDDSVLGTSVGKIGAIEPGGTGHAGGAGYRTKVEPASLQISVEADATSSGAEVIEYDQEKLNRDDRALLNIVVGSITNPTDEDIEVSLWCVIRADGEIVASTQNTPLKIAAGATHVANASSGGVPGDSADCSLSTIVS